MKIVLTTRRLKRCAVFLSVMVLFSSIGVVMPPKASALTLSEEKELGSKILAKIREQVPLVEDGEIFSYLQAVGNRIAKQFGTTSYKYQFFVVDAAVPNAFAIPGGYVFIYRGLIEMMSTEGELASILCHELAHIQARHIHRRLESGKVASIAAVAGVVAAVLLGMKTDPSATQALAMGSVAGAASYQLQYSRENEEEADQLGLRYLIEAGYAPQDMVNIMRKMGQESWRTHSKIPTYLSTHPDVSARVEYLKDLIEKQHGSSKKPSSVRTEGDFPIMQAALVAEYANTQLVMDRFQEKARKGDTAAVYGMGRLYLRQGNLAEGLPYLQEAARLDSGSPFILSSLGAAYFQQGKLTEAQKVLRTALLLNPSAFSVHYRLASVLMDLGQKEEALEHLRQIEDFSYIFLDIDYQLGVVLGQVNKLGLAHYHLGRYYENKRDLKLAVFHYRKAKALLRDSPEKAREVEHVLKEIEKQRKEDYWELKR